ncbi:MAG TPA: DUF1365 domain-containing protein [Steroidobacteraceae bacterium]|nr:DUF1365 domain-containing protein [Steroidobacteraceae bacterium]
MHSALYTGRLDHRRFAPRAHQFSYRLFMMYLDLAELDEIFRGRWLWSARRPALAWLKRADYLGDASLPLDTVVRARVAERTGVRPPGPIRMLTHLRYFGVGFNPVTFYYCFDAADTRVESIVAEITNTPWNERHAYVLTDPQPESMERVLRYRFAKQFHVSPFMPMEADYDWRFGTPGKRLSVHMQNYEHGERVFDATLDLSRREISTRSLAHALAAFPCMTASVLTGIYTQAFRLWWKRIPFHANPSRADDATSQS